MEHNQQPKPTNHTSPVTYNLRREERHMVDMIAQAQGTPGGPSGSKSQVVRDAIRFYAIAHDQQAQGHRMVFIGADGKTTEISELWHKPISSMAAPGFPPAPIPAVANQDVPAVPAVVAPATAVTRAPDDVQALLKAMLTINKDPGFETMVNSMGVEVLINIGKQLLNK
jgi:hypothetical protein